MRLLYGGWGAGLLDGGTGYESVLTLHGIQIYFRSILHKHVFLFLSFHVNTNSNANESAIFVSCYTTLSW